MHKKCLLLLPNRSLNLFNLWTSYKVRYKQTGPVQISQPHPSLFLLTSSGQSTKLFDSSIDKKLFNFLLNELRWIPQYLHAKITIYAKKTPTIFAECLVLLWKTQARNSISYKFILPICRYLVQFLSLT